MTQSTSPSTTSGPRASGGATMKDVARLAGVSVSTASRALAGNPRIGERTRVRVEQAALELHYVVNGLAQSMMGVGTKTLAFMTTAFLAEPFARIAQGVDLVAKRHDAMLLMNATRNDPQAAQDAVSMLARQRAAGVLMVGSRNMDEACLQRFTHYRDTLAAVQATLVLCGSPRMPGLDDAPSVSYDQRHGVVLATRALLDAGHRRIAFLGHDDRTSAHERFLGFRDAMLDRGFMTDADDPLVIHSANVSDELDPAIRALLSQDTGHRPTAIVCVTDFAAYRVYRIARELGLRLPDDLSVTGFDDLSTDDTVTPPLSSVCVPYEQVGDYAARLALRLPVELGDHPVFPVTFTARDSIVPPHA
ncbi:LacI family DNA-binding transcriptional regulator [Bifidobacterium aerophilum]|uniref:LacI family DNA-binding transcriptional regulator n=1 Tax=Bifidobacterium aerophilum TaxID=1798155 RepID=A0A6N9Z2U6_9BIFI|nr:LacI family DNA-binding transcriptional regulator [Bifidobacterium aerophilum]NEG88525.1 LacI family DNA-binding transcriptional regulator [Bifidobacterium aerophilum]